MSKITFSGYVFDPVNNRIGLPDIISIIPDFTMKNVQLVTNLDTGQIICLPQLPTKRATWDGSYLNLLFDVSGMSNTDELQVILNDWVIPNANEIRVSITDDVPVTGAVAILEPVEVSNFPAVQNVQVANFPTTEPAGLTNNQLRAVSVPVSGVITANAGTNLNTSELATEITVQLIANKDFATQSTLSAILTAIQTQRDLSESIWKDDNGIFFIRRTVLLDGVYTVTYVLANGTSYTPVGTITLATSNADLELRDIEYRAVTTGTGYSIDDYIVRTDLFNTSVAPAVLVSTIWFNKTTGSVLGTVPVSTDITAADKVQITATSLPLPTGAASEETLQNIVMALTGSTITRYLGGEYLASLAGGVNRDYVLTVGNKTTVSFWLEVFGEVLITVYEAPTTSGTPVNMPLQNLNRNDTAIAQTVLNRGLTVSAVGTVIIPTCRVPDNITRWDSGINAKIGLKANTDYLIRVTARQATFVSIGMYVTE